MKGDSVRHQRGDVGNRKPVTRVGDRRVEGGNALELIKVLEETPGPFGLARRRRLDNGVGCNVGDEVVTRQQDTGFRLV